MKLYVVVATALSAYYAAALYNSGDPCQNEEDCTINCPGGNWTSTFTDPYLDYACDRPSDDPEKFFVAKCLKEVNDPGAPSGERLVADFESTRYGCDVLRGHNCLSGCLISGNSALEERLVDDFSLGCSVRLMRIEKYNGELQAIKAAGCN
jgi:hypothetical protein